MSGSLTDGHDGTGRLCRQTALTEHEPKIQNRERSAQLDLVLCRLLTVRSWEEEGKKMSP